MRSKYDFVAFTFDHLAPILSKPSIDDDGYKYYSVGTLTVNRERHNSICVDFTYHLDGRTLFECDGIQRTDIPFDIFFGLRNHRIALLRKKQLVF